MLLQIVVTAAASGGHTPDALDPRSPQVCSAPTRAYAGPGNLLICESIGSRRRWRQKQQGVKAHLTARPLSRLGREKPDSRARLRFQVCGKLGSCRLVLFVCTTVTAFARPEWQRWSDPRSEVAVLRGRRDLKSVWSLQGQRPQPVRLPCPGRSLSSAFRHHAGRGSWQVGCGVRAENPITWHRPRAIIWPSLSPASGT